MNFQFNQQLSARILQKRHNSELARPNPHPQPSSSSILQQYVLEEEKESACSPKRTPQPFRLS